MRWNGLKAALFLAPCGLESPGDFTSSQHFKEGGDPCSSSAFRNLRLGGLPLFLRYKAAATSTIASGIPSIKAEDKD
jgi:hypothetical protein